MEGLEDACLLDDDSDDSLTDKHGCPAYVSPEILNPPVRCYSGKAADIWGVGVMLYTILIGRYPFHDVEPSALFSKIRQGQYVIPDSVSARAKCLIRALLRREPSERLIASEILRHPWFTAAFNARNAGGSRARCARNASSTSSQSQSQSLSGSVLSFSSGNASTAGPTSGHRSNSGNQSTPPPAIDQSVPIVVAPKPEQYPLFL